MDSLILVYAICDISEYLFRADEILPVAYI